jgi:hypothetical protein
MCFNLCNNALTPQSYHWSLAGLPAGSGCTVNGPTVFTPASGTVTVPAGGCSAPICVTIPRPAGLTAQNATACFALTFVNDATGVCHSCTGTIRADNTCWCITPAQTGIVSVPALVAPGFAGVPIVIGFENPCGGTQIPYSLRAVWGSGEHPDPLEVSLNGLPPGEPVLGTLSLDPGGDGELTALVNYPNGYDPAGLYEILLEADTDGDGVMEPICGTRIESVPDTTATTDVPGAPRVADSVRLRTSPNPFMLGSNIAFTLGAAGQVELGIYDLTGRLVRSLQSGVLLAGEHRLEWDGRDAAGHRAPAGIYFARLAGTRLHLEAKLVKLR